MRASESQRARERHARLRARKRISEYGVRNDARQRRVVAARYGATLTQQTTRGGASNAANHVYAAA